MRILARSLAICVMLGGCLLAAHGQTSRPFDFDSDATPGKHQWITFVGPEQQDVKANQPADVALHFRIEQGFHINSHTPHDISLIPTQLMIVETPGLTAQKVDFPAGSKYSFSFDPKTLLDVYTGDVTLLAHLQVAPGLHPLQAVLRYQACDHAACYPPKTLPLEVKLIAK